MFHTWLCYVETERHRDGRTGRVPTVWTRRRRRFLGTSAHLMLRAQCVLARRRRIIVLLLRFTTIRVIFDSRSLRKRRDGAVRRYNCGRQNVRLLVDPIGRCTREHASLAWVLLFLLSVLNKKSVRQRGPEYIVSKLKQIRAYGRVTALSVWRACDWSACAYSRRYVCCLRATGNVGWMHECLSLIHI